MGVPLEGLLTSILFNLVQRKSFFFCSFATSMSRCSAAYRLAFFSYESLNQKFYCVRLQDILQIQGVQ